MGKRMNFQVDGVVVCEVDVEPMVLRASIDGKPIGKVAAVLGASNRPTGVWMYELHSDDKTKNAGDNWNAGRTYQAAMVLMLKRAKIIKK